MFSSDVMYSIFEKNNVHEETSLDCRRSLAFRVSTQLFQFEPVVPHLLGKFTYTHIAIALIREI